MISRPRKNLIAIFFLNLAIATEGLPTQIANAGSPRCFDYLGREYVGIIPNENTCSGFFQCHTVAWPQRCPTDLLFNFGTCRCDFQQNAECFNVNNCTHARNIFKCAVLVQDADQHQFTSDIEL